VRINYFSDIHIEFGALNRPKTNADLVIAAGDIGIKNQGINWLKAINKPVIYVAGNHEFYNHEYNKTLQMFRDHCANSNIYFLERNAVIIDNIRFLGCTLWTNLYAEGKEQAEIISMRLNDFKHIYYQETAFNKRNFTLLHKSSLMWLEKKLQEPFDGKTVVITHHAPLFQSWTEPNHSLKRMAYCNNLETLIAKHDISVWFHGHVHAVNDYIFSETRILSNTRGYKGEREVKKFKRNKMIEI
jgi:predicted phosphodiesterase